MHKPGCPAGGPQTMSVGPGDMATMCVGPCTCHPRPPIIHKEPIMDYRNTFIYRAMTAVFWVIAVALFAHIIVRGGEAGTCLLRGGKLEQVPNPTRGQVLTLDILTCKERR